MTERQVLDSIENRLREIETLLRHLLSKERHMTVQLDELQAQVEESVTVETSAVTLIKGIADRIAAAGIDPVKLEALEAELHASAQDLSAAITANTPAQATADPGAADTVAG